ncbi:MAG: 4-alpha-glucanotransferase [Lachnospiraceae bacterium]|nr:4-alpha-glucanotransferase [Lachnospiraceae bacterium]
MRASGILLPISSLPSNYGIGCFSKEAYAFVDGLNKAHQHFWQILPLGQTSFGDSPYQSFSTFAGNPYFIDLEKLIEEGLLTKEECDECDFGDDDSCIDYGKIYEERYDLLWSAFQNSDIEQNEEFLKFQKENEDWLPDYALYMAVKDSFDGVMWTDWEEDIRLRKEEALELYKKELAEDILFYEFIQYEFIKQWMELKTYANSKGVKIIGDIPIYVAFDSADCWADTDLFQFNEKNIPTAVAGCPPDAFAATGQLWGNPLYDWEYHKKTGYKWWIRRVEYSFKLYDMVRIDHFRGFDEYYSIPFGDKTAENGHWEKGPGIELFNAIENRLGSLDIIAEDLGYLTDTVEKLVKDTGYPGMKLIQFAFDSREKSNYLPHTYDKNTVVYTGTHDNDTVIGWYDSISESDREYALKYMNNYDTPEDEIHLDFIRAAMASVSDTAIIPFQDWLGLGSEARINVPSTVGGNWTWRMEADDFSDDVIDAILDMTRVYERECNEKCND